MAGPQGALPHCIAALVAMRRFPDRTFESIFSFNRRKVPFGLAVIFIPAEGFQGHLNTFSRASLFALKRYLITFNDRGKEFPTVWFF